MRSEITADQNLRMAQKMLAQQAEVNALRERATAVLADLDQARPLYGQEGTHDPECWHVHAGCLAARVRATLTGERHGDGPAADGAPERCRLPVEMTTYADKRRRYVCGCRPEHGYHGQWEKPREGTT